MKPLLLLSLLIVLGLGAMFLTQGTAPIDGGQELKPSGILPAQAEKASKRQLPDAPVAAPSEQPMVDLVSTPVTVDEPSSPGKQLTDEEITHRLWAAHQLRLGQQYDHLESDGLKDVLAKLQKKIGEQRTMLFKAKFESGDYQIQFIDQPPVMPPEPDSRGRLPQQEVRVQTDPQTMTTQSHIATLALNLYPEYYELLDEETWLLEQIER